MNRKIYISLLILFISFSSFAQNTRSPYSIFGPGELQQKGTGRNMAMGGAGIGMRSGNFVNNLNPASYSGLDSLHFIYEVGFEGKSSIFKSQGDRLQDYTFNFKYISMGFRVNDWWASSFAIAPFSNVGYQIKSTSYIEGTNYKFLSTYEGSGGINQVSWGNAVNYKNLSFGLHSSFLFGSIVQDELIQQPAIFSEFIMQRTDFLRSFYFDYGLQYAFKFKELDFTLGAVYSNEQGLNSRHQVDVKNASYTTISTDEYKSKHLKVPEKIGVGVSVKKGPFFNVVADYETQKWSGLSYPTQKGDFLDTHRFAFGAESKPWGDIVTLNWFKKITYRVGANYKTSFLKIKGIQIDEKALTLGLGIPVKNFGTTLNFTCELGQKGTVSNNLIKENYVLFHMNFSINEIWFKKKIFY